MGGAGGGIGRVGGGRGRGKRGGGAVREENRHSRLDVRPASGTRVRTCCHGIAIAYRGSSGTTYCNTMVLEYTCTLVPYCTKTLKDQWYIISLYGTYSSTIAIARLVTSGIPVAS